MSFTFEATNPSLDVCGGSGIDIVLCAKIKPWFTHYYFEIPQLSIEFHPGYYPLGNITALGTTNGIEIETNKYCTACINNLLQTTTPFSTWSFPILNCESYTRLALRAFPVSLQIIGLVLALLSILLFCIKCYSVGCNILLLSSIFATVNPKLKPCPHIPDPEYQ